MSSFLHVVDVDEPDFEQAVIARSHETPVVVDFWAAWCGPCRTLGPALESAVGARGGDVVLAKVDVDRNPALAQRFGVRGILAVKAFRDGTMVAQFTGAIPPDQIERFLDQVVPSEADRIASAAAGLVTTDPETAEKELRRALELEPGHRVAAIRLAELLAERDPLAALDLLAPHRPDPAAEAVASRAQLALGGDLDEEDLRRRLAADPSDSGAQLDLGRLLAARGDYAEAIERLLAAVRAGGDARESAREQLLRVFTVLGDGDDLVRDGRRQLASALY